jgi:hypothetical protein
VDRTAALALPALLALFAGCASSPVAPASPPLPAEAWPWGIEGCAFVIAMAPVDAQRLQQHLPEGFQPAQAGQAEVHFDAYDCRGATGPGGGDLGPTQYGSVYVPVSVPAPLKVPGYGLYFLKTDFLVPDDGVRALFLGHGFPAWDGRVSIDASAAGAAWQVSSDLGDGGGFAFTGAAGPASPQQAPLPFVEYTPLAGGGLARWHARLHDASIASGRGLLRVQGGWAEDVVGAGPVPASFIAGMWNLDEAGVEFPVPWPAA